ncbi:MAG: hypothetical protein D6E12_06210 [Desulfovibrio sp.]|nr:MAG: hypothetical protein D6E12_06210 [Desulfovibrio sp.]
MISTGFWIVYGTLVALITGLAALTLYVAQSAIKKSFIRQEEALASLLAEQEQHLRKEITATLELSMDQRLSALEARMDDIINRLERARQAAKAKVDPRA